MNNIKRAVSVVLIFTLILTGCFGLNVAAATEDSAEIVSADMSLESAKNNAQQYYSNEEWAEEYPDGLFVIEYNSYEITEGGPDSENPEDVYLGVNIYRIGGNSQSATLTYDLITISGDSEMYPDCLGTVDFAPQQVTATAKIKIPNDDKRNGNQLIMMSLTEATLGMISDASTTVIKIFDDEPYVESVLTMVADSAVTDKSQCGVTFTVKRTENDTDYCTAVIKTSDGTAKAGVDYEAFEEEIVFAAGVTEHKVTIPLIQSDEKFTEPKTFTVTLSDIRGGVLGGTDSMRLNITNELKKDTSLITSVDGNEADMTVDESSVLANSMTSVLNENDTLERTDMLKAAIGAANGKAVLPLAQTGLNQELADLGDTSYWNDTLVIPNSKFMQLYSSGDKWKPDEEFTDADEDLLIASDSQYDFNLYDAIVYSCISRDKEGLGSLSGNPNTAFGYLDTTGHKYTDDNISSSPETDINSAGSSDRKWMTDNDIYILSNKVQTNVDWKNTPMTYRLDKNGSRYPKTTGPEGSAMRPFYFVYNVSGQDDNHFTLYNTQLVRSVIPFTVFENNDNYTVNSNSDTNKTTVSFVKNSYKWTIGLDAKNKAGGIAVDGNKNAYGFYAGSRLKVTFETAGEQGASVPVPTILYLKDADGNIHNFSKFDANKVDNSFFVNLETNMSNDSRGLKDTYLLTEDEAMAHNKLLSDNNCINSMFDSQLTIDCQYAIQQGIKINYANLTDISEIGHNEPEAVYKERIKRSLDGVVKFYKDGKEIQTSPNVNTKEFNLEYGVTDFDKIVVDPTVVSKGVKATSNLYSAEYKTITRETEIQRFVCAQVSTEVIFTLTYLESNYIDPQISLASTYVSHKTDSGFETVYRANYIDDNIPFEALFTDTSQVPEMAYYSMNFVISDIYVGSATDSLAVKDYPVTVYAGDINSQNAKKLFSFTFHGGATYAQAKNLDLKIEDGVFDSEYLPVAELVSYSSNGYEYRMYIPTYYNYQNPNDVTYPNVIGGGQGVTIEIADYDRGDDETQSDVVATLDPYSTQYVCHKLPDTKGDSPAETAEGMYFEQQEDFYTYTDHVVNANTSAINLDLTGLGSFISKIFALKGNTEASKKALQAAGHGVYIKFLDNQMTIGLKMGYNTQNKGAPKKDNTPPEIEMDEFVGEDMMGFVELDPPVQQPVAEKSSLLDKVKNTAKVTNSAYDSLTFSFLFDGKVDLSYNSVRNEWDFSKFTVTLSGGFGFSKGIPIPAAANLVYATFSVKGNVAISSGFSAVKDYVDLDGNVNYAFSFNGVSVAPSLAISLGVGVGISGILSLEAGGTAEVAFAVTFGSQKVTPKLKEEDLDTNVKEGDQFTAKYVGNWKTCLVSNTADDEYLKDGANEYFYNNTYVISEQKGDSVTLEATGTAFQLVGVTKADGGEIKVTVYIDDSDTPVQEPQILSLASENIATHTTLYEWKMADFDDPEKASPVKMKVVIENNGGKVILDSVKAYNEENRASEFTVASFDSVSVRLSMYLKATVTFISLALEPAYMLIKYSDIDTSGYSASITLGTVYYSKTWDVSSAKTLQESTDEDLPVVMVGSNALQSRPEIDYFDTGEFSAEKTKTLLQGDIDKSSKTQVINYNGKNYTFYTVLSTDETTGVSRYELYCATPDFGTVLVSEDIYVGDFNAYIDHNSKLCVELTASDSTVTDMHKSDNDALVIKLSDGKEVTVEDASQVSEILQRMCVKVASYNGDGTFSTEVIKGTDSNGYQESLPVSASAENNSVVFFVEDEAEYNSDFTLNWESFDKNSSAVKDVEGLINSMYSGQARIRYAVNKGSGFDETQIISIEESLESRFDAEILTGIKVTDIDAETAQDGTVCLVYSIELFNASKGGHKGTLLEIHYREGVFSEDGTLSFSDALVIDSVFDYDEDLEEVLSADDLTSKYYNATTGELYENPVLRNVQMENAILCESGVDIQDKTSEPCLFYQTNGSINYVTYSTLSKALTAKTENSGETFTVGVLYSGYFNDYIIAVSEAGAINLIYNENTETSAYTDTLNIIDYDAENKVWNNKRQLTYSDIFDADALSDREKTYGMTIDNLSAFVDGKGNVTVAFKSTYAPFTYEYGVNEEDLKDDNAPVDVINNLDGVYVSEDGTEIPYMITPMLDFESEETRSDIYMISFKERVTAVDVSGFDMQNKVFAPGKTISLDFDINNIGDNIIHDLYLSLYICDEDRQVSNSVASKVLSGSSDAKEFENGLLAGDSIEQYISFVLNDMQNNNSLLCLRIRDENDNVLFDSYESFLLNTNSSKEDDTEITYHQINNCAELEFNAVDVDVDAEGKMTFSAEVANIGTVSMTEPVKVYFEVYLYDEEGNQSTKTAFSFTHSPLAAGESDVITDHYDVSDYIQDGELHYSFDISCSEPQFDMDNDSTGIITCYQMPEISVDSANVSSGLLQGPSFGNVHSGINLTLGDVLELDNTVLSDVYRNENLRAYEIGSECLSIDNSMTGGKIRVKAVDIPESNRVKLLLNIKGTSIYRYIYLYISDKGKVNFNTKLNSEGWSLSDAVYMYAEEKDVFVTHEDKSSFTFSFHGDDLSIYGDYLTNGGDFKLTVTDSKGKTIIKETVSTNSQLEDVGMLLYKSEKLMLDRYNVTIDAILEEGEQLSLDFARFTIDTSDADTSPYASVSRAEEILDAPLINGRARKARFNLTFSNDIKLAEGVKFEDITLEFNEYEYTDGEYVPTGNTVTFTAENILGERILVFSTELQSRQGIILKYVLADSCISDNCVVTQKGTAVDTAIPDFDKVSYVLKESGILSVTVADDKTMPDGSVKKSVKVKFMTAPDLSRLEGTKLLYKTVNSQGEEKTIEFMYSEMTQDPRIAVYRADSLELEKDEMSKVFSFNEGIVLGEDSYVLVTAEGDYLDNDISKIITDKTQLDITYTKLESVQSTLSVLSEITENGFESTPVLYADFESEVNISELTDSLRAFVTVNATVTDNATGSQTQQELTLYADSLSEDRKTICFKAENGTVFEKEKTVEYTLVSNSIGYTGDKAIKSAYDGIEVNPALKKAKALTFNTSAYIVSATPFFEGGFKPRDNSLCAEVVFSGAVDEATLKNTTLSVAETAREYDYTRNRQLVLAFESAELKGSGENAYTVATYKYISDTDDISFSGEEYSKTYELSAELSFDEASPVKSADGKWAYTPAILQRERLSVSKLQASNAEIMLTENGDNGYKVGLNLTFDEDVLVTVTDEVYAVVDMTIDDTAIPVYLCLNSVQGNTLSFVCDTPLALRSGDITTFTLRNRIVSPATFVTDANGIPVSQWVEGMGELVVDTSHNGLVTKAVMELDSAQKDKLSVSAHITFDEKLNANSFEGAVLKATQLIYYADGSQTAVETEFVFAEFSEENTAVFTAEVEMPKDADGTELVLHDTIAPASGSFIYNSNRTLILSTAVPRTSDLEVSKICAYKVAFATDGDKEKIDTINDVEIHITYPESISADRLEGITLNAGVRGIKNVTEVMFKATRIADGKTLIFVPAEDVDREYARLLTVSLNNAKLSLSEDSALYSTVSGLSVSTAIKDAKTVFLTASEVDFFEPVYTEPSSELTCPSTTASDNTETSEGTDSFTADADNTESGAYEDHSDSKPQDGSYITTGISYRIVLIAVAMMIAAIVIVLLLRKKKA